MLSLALGLFIYGLAKFNKRFIFSSLFCFVCYQTLIINDDLKTYHQQKIIFFSLRKNYAAAFINGRNCVLVTDLNETDKNYDFFVKPALSQLQVDKISLIDLKRDTIQGNFILKNNQIVFADYKILIINDALNYKKLEGNGDFSSLWISGNTKFKLATLSASIKYKNVLIDATNKDYKIEIFKKVVKNNHLAAYVLKKNKAYLVQLTQ
ncbi:hypothetical protein ASE74_09635 [Pedobacter sp. Leaf216]|nr:hypothetical protein ASE74_09635 [Pedobacter sp. Leaf216]